MLTAIAPREKPVSKGPSTPMDYLIMDVLKKQGPSEPRQIRDAIEDSHLQYIHARLRRLVGWGVLVRVENSDPKAPRRGPGSSLYQLP